MGKKVLHLQIPIKGDRRDDLLISPTLLKKFLEFIEKNLGEEWVVITSPMQPTSSDTDDGSVNFDMSEISRNEFLDMVGERSVSARSRRAHYDVLAWWNYKKWELKYEIKDMLLDVRLWWADPFRKK